MPASGNYALVRVRDDLLVRLGRHGITPVSFLEFLLDGIDPAEWIARYKAPVASTPNPDIPDTGSGTNRRTGWSQETLLGFLQEVQGLRGFREPLLLLAAFSDLGPRPTADQLRATCGFGDDERLRRIWNQELRAAKTRLTIQARHRKRPSLFLPPTGRGGARVHPIDSTVHGWIAAWAASLPRGEPPLRWGASPHLREKYAERMNKEPDSTEPASATYEGARE